MLERLKVKRKSNDELILDISDGDCFIHSDYNIIADPIEMACAIERKDGVIILYMEQGAYVIHKDYTAIEELPNGKTIYTEQRILEQGWEKY